MAEEAPALRTVVVSGASGLVGGALATALELDGVRVVRLVRRRPAPGGWEVGWDPGTGRIDARGLELHAGDDVSLSLLLPAMDAPVEGRARVVRQPVEERLGLRFEAFSGNGDARIREFLAALGSPSSP